MKTIDSLPVAEDLLPLRAVRGLADDSPVDRRRRVVRGAVLIQKGELNEGDARKWVIDDVTLNQVVSLGSATTRGLKARWSHPNMSNDGMGKFLGRWRDLRLSDDGESVLADVHLAKVAFRGGKDSLGDYVLDMADNDPDAFGVSIAPGSIDHEEMEKLRRDDGLMPLRLKKLTAADIVDDPAAVRGGFFGEGQLSLANAPLAATQVLDALFPEATEEVIRTRSLGFLDRYLGNRFQTQGGPTMADETPATAPAAITEESLQTSLAAFQGQLLATVDERLSKHAPDAGEPGGEGLTESDKIAAEGKRVQELYALAQNAGLNDWQQQADKWVAAGLSVVEAKAAIADLAIAGNGLTNGGGQKEDDPHASFRKEFREQKTQLAKFGVTDEDAYVRSRCRDEGLEVPAISK